MTDSPDSIPPASRSNVPRAIAALAVLALIAGVAVALGPWARRGKPSGADQIAAPVDSSENAVGRALGQAHDDSLNRWVADVPGADLAGLDSDRRWIFVRFANAERCTCGCGFTLAACRVYDDQCEVSGPRVAALLDSVRDGKIRTAEGIREGP